MFNRSSGMVVSLVAFGFVASISARADSDFVFTNPTVDFEILDLSPFDGIGDDGPYSTFNTIVLGSTGEAREMAEFDLSSFTVPKGEEITSATFDVRVTSILVFGLGVPVGDTPDLMAVYGYVGNGVEEESDFQAGDANLLDMLDTTSPFVGELLSFDVTSHVKSVVDAGEIWLGVTLAAEEFGGIACLESGPFPRLTIHTTTVVDECEGDANGDGIVDPLDSGYVQSRFGCPVGTGDADCDAADANSDGIADPLDVGYVLSRFGACP